MRRDRERKPMTCPQCGGARRQFDRYCEHCGARLEEIATSAPVAPASLDLMQGAGVVAQSDAASPQVRPWIRYWARMLDLYLFGALAGLAYALGSPGAFSTPGEDQAFGLLATLGWVFTEAGLLAAFGTTPGKYLLNIRLVPPGDSARPAAYGIALTRSFRIWWRGIGAGIPLVAMVTMLVAHRRLTRQGACSWDRDGEWRVVHGPVGFARGAAAVLVFVGMVSALIIAGGVAAGH
jgi:hypothetical protein